MIRKTKKSSFTLICMALVLRVLPNFVTKAPPVGHSLDLNCKMCYIPGDPNFWIHFGVLSYVAVIEG